LESSRAEAAELQRVAAERLAELELKDAELSRVRAEGERRTKELERSALAARDWEAVSRERLEAMHEKEDAIALLDAALKSRDVTFKQIEAAAAERLEGMRARDAALAEMRAALDRAAVDAIGQRERSTMLEAAAAERLQGMEEKEQAIGQLHAELQARDAALAALQAAVERAAADAKAQREG